MCIHAHVCLCTNSTLDMFKVSVRGVAILLGHVILKECKSGKQFASIVTGYTY